MIVNHIQRWVYFGPPKTGSTTMHAELTKSRFSGVYVTPGVQHDTRLPPGTEEYFKFATVRDPYSRAASLYWHFLTEYRAMEAETTGVEPSYLLPFRTDYFSFEVFMRHLLDGVLPGISGAAGAQDFYVRPISWWLTDVRLDATLQLEQLNAQFQNLPIWADRDISPGFGKYNSPGTPSWRFMRNPAVIPLIEQWAAADFVRYNYPRLSGHARGPGHTRG